MNGLNNNRDLNCSLMIVADYSNNNCLKDTEALPLTELEERISGAAEEKLKRESYSRYGRRIGLKEVVDLTNWGRVKNPFSKEWRSEYNKIYYRKHRPKITRNRRERLERIAALAADLSGDSGTTSTQSQSVDNTPTVKKEREAPDTDISTLEPKKQRGRPKKRRWTPVQKAAKATQLTASDIQNFFLYVDQFEDTGNCFLDELNIDDSDLQNFLIEGK